MKPKALPSALTGRQATAGVTLDALAEQVLQLADGTRTVSAIALEAKASEREVWAALDWLSDAGLLEMRIAPPAAAVKVSRRSLLESAVAARVALPFAASLTAAFADEKPADKKTEKQTRPERTSQKAAKTTEQRKKASSTNKATENKQKADSKTAEGAKKKT